MSATPSSAFHNSGLATIPKPGPSSSKTKPPSLSIASPGSGSLPRPLQLATGSVINSSPSVSPSPSPHPHEVSKPSVPSGSKSGSNSPRTGEAGHRADSVLSPAPTPTGESATPLSPTISSVKRQSINPRRQSSISYIPSNSSSHSPSPSRSHFSRRESVDVHSLAFARSPLSSTHTTTPFSVNGYGQRSPGLGRSNSVGRNGRASNSKALRSPGIERSSTGSLLGNGHVGASSKEADTLKHLKERAPVTLGEKHAELLHFIAQKESKCLELRSQLSVHEAELLQLKRKWERIVNRGFGKSLSPTPPTTANGAASSTSPISQTSASPSPSPHSSTFPSATEPSYFPVLSPNADVLEGIKDGVSRLIAAGLGSISGPAASSSTSEGASASNTPAHGQLPLRLGSVSTKRATGHVQKESQSSSNSNSTTFSSASGSSLLSHSTAASSVTSATSVSGSSTTGNATAKSVSASDADLDASEEAESEFGEFEDGQRHPSNGDVDGGGHSRDDSEQVLMVHDTGATPTMSPNPAFRRRKSKERGGRSGSTSPSRVGKISATTGGLLVEKDKDKVEDFDWDDGWDEPGSEAQFSDQQMTASITEGSVFSSNSASTSSAATVKSTTKTFNKNLGKTLPPPSAPGISSISGLATMGMAGPSAQQVSSWVGTVGKKWGEIKGSPTFSKNQKRASVLISDMQQNILSALTSPTPTTPSSASGPTPASSTNQTTTTLPSSPFSSNGFYATAPSTIKSPSLIPQPQPQAKRQMSTSLLDDSDDESYGEGVSPSAGVGGASREGEGDETIRMKIGLDAPVLVPDSVIRPIRTGKETAKKVKAGDADEDEWNW